jgi:hypothetical protein
VKVNVSHGRHPGSNAILARISLAIGIVAGLASPLFVLTSPEAQRRIRWELGLVEYTPPTGGKTLLQSMSWQGPSVLFVSGAILANVIGLTFAAIAMLRSKQKEGVLVLAFCLNVIGIGCGTFVCWGIS